MNEQPVTKFKQAYPEVKDIGNDLSSLKDNIGNLGAHIKKDGMHDLSDATAEACGSMKKMGQKMEAHIKNEPMQSLAIAFVSGLTISLLMARR